jgi:SPP1 family predicted phage head-tail adaptor
MRAGNLDRVITIERESTALDLYGAPIKVWTSFATMRVQVLQFATDDQESERGNTTDTKITFRMRWMDGLTLDNRVCYQGQPFVIRQIKEIGRRIGLDVVCERVGP